jgi:hypothetical protein
MRRLAGVLGVLATAFLVVVMAAPAHAQVLPTVRISGTTPMSEADQCFTEPVFSPGSFTLERDVATGTLDVNYHITGGPTDLNSDPVAGEFHTATFADGQTQVTVTVHPALGGVGATVTVVPPVDPGPYQVGNSNTATIQRLISVPQCVVPGEAPPPTTAPRTLARTGSTSSTFGLVLIGVGLIVAGMAMKRVADSRLR